MRRLRRVPARAMTRRASDDFVVSKFQPSMDVVEKPKPVVLDADGYECYRAIGYAMPDPEDTWDSTD